MELYQLAYFVEAARQRNFTRAAERLRIAQPALSQQMRRLEEELGTPLFVRGRKQTVLTPAGEAFHPQALALLSLAENARQVVAEVAQLRRGRLMIASIPTLSACWLPPIIQRFRRQHPFIELVLREESSEDVAELVESGAVELGFLQLPVNRTTFDLQELFTEPFVVLVPPQHPLAGRRAVRLAQLAGEPFISYKGKARNVALEACRNAGFEPRIACESGELETVRALVQANLGVAILPRMALSQHTNKATVLQLREPALERKLGLVTRRNHLWSAAAKALVTMFDLSGRAAS
jgi:LysR family hydrogen peroxide-inducible transcriptional activator